MVELIQAISNFGILIVIAAIFIYQSVVSNQKIADTLKVIGESNENISKTLDLLTKLQNEDIQIGRETLDKVNCIKIKAGYK